MTPAALPPILLRNTYPPGQPEMGYPPKLLRRTPQGADEIMFPGSLQGTLFQGPVLSGPAPGIDGAVGAARLTLSLQIDWTMGNFQIPVPFPGASFLLAVNAVTVQDGLAAFITLGTEQGQGDICTVAPPPKDSTAPMVQPMVQLPLWDAVLPQEPFVAWLNVSANTGATAGIAIVLVDYVRVAPAWSAPATNHNRP